MASELLITDFEQLLDEEWWIRFDDHEPIRLVLKDVKSLVKHTESEDARQPFSLVFESTADIILPQRVYYIEHKNLTVEAIFLVPIGNDQHGTRYEAVYT